LSRPDPHFLPEAATQSRTDTGRNMTAVRRHRLFAHAVALGVAYAGLSAIVTAITSFGATTGATFWPGAGLTVAVLLVCPRREWPALLGAVAIAELAMDLVLGYGLGLAVSWALANTAEPAVAAWVLLRGARAAPDLSNRQDLARFIGFAVLAGPLLGAVVGTAAGMIVTGDAWWPRLPRWWVGDGIGVLVVAPLLLVVLTGRWHLPRLKETWPLALLAATAGVALGPWAFAGTTGLPFLVLPALGLAALRLRTPGAALAVLLVAVLVEAVTALGAGPFADPDAFRGLVVAQMFLTMNALVALAVAALMTDLVSRDEVERRLRAEAWHDSLTGLPNRRMLLNRLEMASRRLAREPGVLTLLFIDLDGFKHINDTFGHPAGDHVLIQTGRRLRSVVRDADTVARLGGDEFVVLAQSIDSVGDSYELAVRALRAIEMPHEWRGQTFAVTSSIGIATSAEPLADVAALLNRSDRAMYEAKRDGPNRIGGLGELSLTDPWIGPAPAAPGPF
jgi:diguanylate cyclase (GGDEF)-like protein